MPLGSIKGFSSLNESAALKSLMPHALYHLAKSELALKMQESAVKRLQDLIRDYPQDVDADAARSALVGIEHNL